MPKPFRCQDGCGEAADQRRCLCGTKLSSCNDEHECAPCRTSTMDRRWQQYERNYLLWEEFGCRGRAPLPPVDGRKVKQIIDQELIA